MKPYNKFILKKYFNNLLSIFPDNVFKNNNKNFVILMYHRVSPEENFFQNPNYSLNVTPEIFEDHIKFLCKNYEIASIDDTLQLKSKNKKIVITFDDGYKDNIKYALPILEKYNAKATIYITTRFIENETWTWWYDLWEYISNNDQLLVNSSEYNANFIIKSVKQKLNCYKYFTKYFKKINYEKQLWLMKKIDNNFKLNQNQLFLNWNEVITLDRHKLITIGAHTHTHASLKNLSDKESSLEILNSKNFIEKKINHKVKHFAYPYGTSFDFGIREMNTLKNFGFKTAVTTMPHNKKKSIYSLPRLAVDRSTNIDNINSKINDAESFFRSIFLI